MRSYELVLEIYKQEDFIDAHCGSCVMYHLGKDKTKLRIISNHGQLHEACVMDDFNFIFCEGFCIFISNLGISKHSLKKFWYL